MTEASKSNWITVLAGVNGAGKSSVLTPDITGRGGAILNPDAEARLLMEANPNLTVAEANGLAWHQGKQLLERAIADTLAFAFETSLGGKSITDLLLRALSLGRNIRVLYVGLEGVQLHIDRVRARVSAGGHDIPEETIRRRYDTSRENLIRLLPTLTELRLFDNSAEADPATGALPEPIHIMRTAQGRIVESIAPELVPRWAKPIVAAALGLY